MNEHHFFTKIYLSYFILERVAKGLCVRGEVGDGNRLQHIDSKFICIIAAPILYSAGLLNRGPEGPSPLSEADSHCNSNCNSLTSTNWNRQWHRVIYLFAVHQLPVASQLHRIQPVHGQVDTLISSTGCTSYLHRCIS